MSNRPVLAVTMGDPAGVGPEVVVRAVTDPAVLKIARPVVVGNAAYLRRAIEETSLNAGVTEGSMADPQPTESTIWCLPREIPNPGRISRAEVSAAAGEVAYKLVVAAAETALEGAADGIVTAPLHKESLRLAGVKEEGHTEILAHMCDAPHVALTLVTDRLRISHVTTHVPLSRVSKLVTAARVLTVVRLTAEFLSTIRVDTPVGVLGLNPHAGEHGLFGTEDEDEIRPAVEQAQSEGLGVEGPVPADTAIHWAATGRYGALVAMYHDQGHVPVKLDDFYGGVNVTLGLPIIRTSVDHGTAFDIVGTGTADPSSMVRSLKLASEMSAGHQTGDLRSTRPSP